MLRSEVVSDDLDALLRGRDPHASDFKDLGVTQLAESMNLTRSALDGKWCRACDGIWFGLPFEVECPVCGSRRDVRRRP